jgi:2'-5' RNA ligase
MGHTRSGGGAPIETQVANPASGIERLFVALPVPTQTAQALSALQPPSRPGIRLTHVDDLHVTLHFLGNGQVTPVRKLLPSVRAPGFAVTLSELGSFDLRGGRRVLWVGVEPSAPLGDLHRQVGAALERLGFEPEQRAYVPHITLARLARMAKADIRNGFLGQSLPAAAACFDCTAFALYASESTRAGPRYRIVERYDLVG